MSKYILMFVLLAGCTDINNYELNNAKAICKDHGGVDYITAFVIFPNAKVRCGDGHAKETHSAK